MTHKMSIFGVGPRIAIPTATYAAIGGLVTWLWPQVCIIPAFPRMAALVAGIVLLVLGVPMLAIAGRALTLAYNSDRLATTGIFGLTRNPIYSAWIVFIIPGLVLMSRSWPLFLTPIVAYLAFKVHIRREDEYLEQRFGDEYRRYKARVSELVPFPRKEADGEISTACLSAAKRMKLPFFGKKKHLQYASILGWLHGESVPKNFFLDYGSGKRPDYKIYVDQFCELRQHLFNKHCKTLPKEIQEQLKAREHSSQSHSKCNQAEPVLQRLQDTLSGIDFVKEVSIKEAQMDLVQFNVALVNEPTVEQYEMIPEFFEGYVVNIVWASLQ